jgi:hypothetical protein
VGPATVGMGKAPRAPENAAPPPPSCCSRSCWSRNSAPPVCKMQMQKLLQQLLEMV